MGIILVFMDSGDFTPSNIPANWANNPFSIFLFSLLFFDFVSQSS